VYGYVLPSGARRSPYASWVAKSKIGEVSAESLESYWLLCPDFVIELKSKSDRLRAKTLIHRYLDAEGLPVGRQEGNRCNDGIREIYPVLFRFPDSFYGPGFGNLVAVFPHAVHMKRECFRGFAQRIRNSWGRRYATGEVGDITPYPLRPFLCGSAIYCVILVSDSKSASVRPACFSVDCTVGQADPSSGEESSRAPARSRV
jgi:hypothetical protein